LANPGATNEKVHLYCGGVVFEEANAAYWAAGRQGEVSCHLMDREEAYHAMQEGYINNGCDYHRFAMVAAQL